jgi:hypothetical protein
VIDVAVTCRVVKVSRSGCHERPHRPPSARDVDDAWLTNTILAVQVWMELAAPILRANKVDVSANRSTWSAPFPQVMGRRDVGPQIDAENPLSLLQISS